MSERDPGTRTTPSSRFGPGTLRTSHGDALLGLNVNRAVFFWNTMTMTMMMKLKEITAPFIPDYNSTSSETAETSFK